MTTKPPSRRLLADPAVHVALTALGLLTLSWPLLQVAGNHGTIALFAYVFAVWSAAVVLLLLVARSLEREASSRAEGTADSPGQAENGQGGSP